MSILVTGGAGFIGSHLIERLLTETDQTVVCLDQFNSYYSPKRKRDNIKALAHQPQFHVIEDDICREGAIADALRRHQIREVIHLAAYPGVRYSVERPDLYQQVNVGGTLALLEAVRAHPVDQLLHVSSSTVYGLDATVPFVEDAPLGVPMSPYGATKRASELLVQTYHRLFGIPALILRPFSVYGPRMRPDLAMWVFAEKIRKGDTIPLYGDGTTQRDFTHISDICDGLLAARHCKAHGQIINLGHNEPVPLDDLIHLLEDATKRKAQIKRLPPRSEDLPITAADLTKARHYLNYQPRHSLQQGIIEFVEWQRKYLS